MKIKMSQSSLRNFNKCPKMYYWNKVEGIELKEKGNAVKLGKYVDDILSGKNAEINEEDNGSIWLAKGRGIIRAIDELKLSDNFRDYKKQEKVSFEIEREGFVVEVEGYTDFNTENVIGELKVTTKPDIYLDKFLISEQVGTYLMSKIEYLHVIMYVIQVPELRYNENKENVADYESRCFDDIMRRPGYYFHGYNKDEGRFGVKFMRQEFDLMNLANKYLWLGRMIIMCHEAKFWQDRRSECFNTVKCDYWEACNFGVSFDRYKKREEKP